MKSNQFSGFEYFGYSLLNKFPNPLKKLGLNMYTKLMFNKIKKLKTPINMVFYITNRCNSRCKHCFYWKNLNKNKDELTIDQIKKIANSLKHPLELLAITGGEPFLRKDIVEICNIFYKLNKTKRIAIDTNGLLTEVIYAKIKRLLVENPKKRLSVLVSLDGLEKTHNKVRNLKNGFERVIFTIRKLKILENKYKNLTIFVLTTIQKENIKEISELTKYVKEGLKVVHKLNILRNSKCYYNLDKEILNDFEPSSSNIPSLSELERVYLDIKKNITTISSKIESLKIRYSIDMLKNNKMCVRCLAGKTDGVIFSNGDVSICEPTKPFSNLKETNYDFFKLWNSKEANNMRPRLEKCFCLQPCNLLNAMKYDSKTLMRL